MCPSKTPQPAVTKVEYSMKIFFIVMISLFLIFQYALWFSSGGIIQIWHLKQKIVALEQENKQLQTRNDMLLADVNDLKQGKEAIEERARNDLGMIKKDETFYQVTR